MLSGSAIDKPAPGNATDSATTAVPAPVAKATETVVGAEYLALLQEHMHRLRSIYNHPNRMLHFDAVLATLLIGFYESSVRSLRALDDLSCREGAREVLPVDRVCRSTLSDAMRQMDAGQLQPIVQALWKQVPDLKHADGPLHALLKRIIALDGSVFTVPADVLWAIALTRPDKKQGRQFRLNLQLDVLRFLPTALSVSGKLDGSESAAFARDLCGGVIYVADRGFVDFSFIHAVFDKGSDLVVRLKKDTKFVCVKQNPLTDDRDADVISDRIGYVPGSAGSPGFGDRLLREVVVLDRKNNTTVRLLTSLLDVPARTIGQIYRHRWMIEIFFKWLKCTARLDHLISQSENGVRLQLYVAVIGVLLTHLRTGRRPSIYAANCLAWVASGQMSVTTMFEVLARRERERELERTRLARKRSAEKTGG
ncbi:MAG TPA: IS4 family transposase [Terriglobia bacterium]|nr:IS4 family transposase [Terriglobia bacterium]